MIETNFYISQSIIVIVLISIAYICGSLVHYKGIKVNYTRKINHFAVFFLPPFIDSFVVYNKNMFTLSISMIMSVALLGLYVEPLRERVPILKRAFLSFDRPEDRPHTLFWLSTQFAASALVIIPFVMYFFTINKLLLIFIPILITGIGDGLAEPIGIRFGKHYYQTKALFSKKKYVRTLEGSSCVFIISILTVFAYYNFFTPVQFYAALIMFPILMTLTEALSPHTWDTPSLYLVGGLATVGIIHI